ncbi:MAG TPA: PD-(D/E)XK nuclease family protein [Dissulfurispiraceae bacterium]|nr:PD-(D/E)XK nuclease family protein [Dissulfurispiraceae bacterium]
MKARILTPRLSLVAEVADGLVADGSDFSSNLVIFPGRRPAHFLRRELGQRTMSAFIPPQILSMDDFIDMVYSCAESDDKIMADLDAVALLYDIHLDMEKRIGRSSFTSLDLFFPVGMQLFHDLEEMTIEEISPDKVKALGLETGIVIPSASCDAMAGIAAYAERFYGMIGQIGRSTRATRYRAVARSLQGDYCRKYSRIILAGFFAFTAMERKIVAALQDHPSFICLFQDGPYIDDMLKAYGIEAERTGAECCKPVISLLACPDIHGEVCALGDRIEALRKNTAPDERTAIVLPSAETLFPLLRHTFAGWEERSFNVTVGYPLVRTPIFGFFKSLAELTGSIDGGRLYVPAYTAFVLHPYAKNIRFQGSAEMTRILFHTIEEELSKDAAPSFVTLESLDGNAGMLARAADRLRGEGHDVDARALGLHLKEMHARTIRPFFSITSVGGFAEICIGLIEYIHDNSTAQLHPLFYPYVEAFIAALMDICNSSLQGQSFSDISGYFLFLERYLNRCSVPFEGTPLRGLQVLGALETRGLKFEKIFLLDANEDVMPASGQNNSFLPNRARELLGMPTQKDRDLMSHYHFSIMIGAADEVNIFFIENDRKDKSRFVERLIWEEEQISGRRLGDEAYQNIQYRVHLAGKQAGPVRKTEAVMQRLASYEFSASALDRYISCPLHFYYRDIVGLMPRDVNTGDVEKRDIGTIVHEALRRMLREIGERELTAKILDRVDVYGIVEDIFYRRFGERPFGAPYLLMKQVQRRLESFIRAYLVPLAVGHKVSVLTSESSLRTSYKGHAIAGRPDAVFSIDGRRTIIDFKTSAVKSSYSILFDKLLLDDRESWQRAIGSLQLPLYRILYSASSGAPVAEIDAMYLMLGLTRIDNAIELRLFSHRDDTAAGGAMLSEVIGRLLDEINDPSVPFSVTATVARTCVFCDYGAFCGRRRA